MRPHGTLSRYTAKPGCRCDECRAAMADYHVDRRRAKKHGDPSIPPEPPAPCIPRGWLIAADYPEMVR